MRTVIIGASGGIGGALADAIEEEGEAVLRLSRPTLDLTDEASIAAAAAGAGKIDRVIVATGVLHDGRLDISIDYRVRNTNQSDNLVYPFYYREAR